MAKAAVKSRQDSILEAHLKLRAMSRSLEHYLAQPRPPMGSEESHHWASDLSNRLLELHARLARHFRDEEESGLLDDLVKAYPHAAVRIGRLRGEHDTMLAELRGILNDTMVYAEGRRPGNPRIRTAVLSCLTRLARHEQIETELRQRLYNEELGVGD